MTAIKPVICPDCNQPMEMIELRKVPGDEIRNFLDDPGNELEDNWYWCPKCDFYKQETIPVTSSPDIKRLTKLLEFYSNYW